MGRKAAIGIAMYTNRELGRIFAKMGTSEHPRGGILTAYRQAHRALRDVIRREAFAEVEEVLYFLEADVQRAVDRLLRTAQALGEDTAERQLKELDEEAVHGAPGAGIALMQDAWMNLVRDQATRSRALLLAGGDPVLLIGDTSRQGIIRPEPVTSEGSKTLATVVALSFMAVVNRSLARKKEQFERQAVAAIDGRTTDCCLQVHGQIVGMDEPFHLTGTPRFADRIMSPPFHWYCRTSQVLVKVGEGEDELTEQMREAAGKEMQVRETTGKPSLKTEPTAGV